MGLKYFTVWNARILMNKVEEMAGVSLSRWASSRICLYPSLAAIWCPLVVIVLSPQYYIEDASSPPPGWNSQLFRKCPVSWYPLGWNDPRRWSYKNIGHMGPILLPETGPPPVYCWPAFLFSFYLPKSYALDFTSIWELGLSRERQLISTQKFHYIWIHVIRVYAFSRCYC